MTLHEMLSREDYLSKSLSEWQQLLTEQDGFCSDDTLLEILNAKIDAKNKAVNIFDYGDKTKWIDRDTRTALQNLISSGAETITLDLKDNDLLDISASELKEFLDKLEVYAGKCFAATAKHKVAMSKFTSTEDILNYDFTANYPSKIRLK